jgi:DNA-nicking Smr family endonuclease
VNKKGRDLTADEHKLWRRVASSVKSRRPVKAVTLAEESEVRAPAKPASRPQPAAPAPLTRRQPTPPTPQNRQGEKRVRRGKLEVGASIDLHGHTQDSARVALIRFLRAAHKRGERTVIVITGAGRSGQGVLKQRFPEWIGDRDVRDVVAGFAPAHRSHGGAGAFYVFLKRPKSTLD